MRGDEQVPWRENESCVLERFRNLGKPVTTSSPPNFRTQLTERLAGARAFLQAADWNGTC